MKTVDGKISRCRLGKPIITLDSFFNGMEIRPNDLRNLAKILNEIADRADQQPPPNKYFQPTKFCLDVK